ncbi:transcription factor ABORTED MICROSPORES [Lactuca sativa]|uniref:BHLH domain-containing protein n=1 Tax=Lactuca sativa TaxID=4236 RepID=A0A9R1UM16_LACSA|nr:transcription factor ABORTED MICROSPORES [Lactuca sativa]KAJ0189375.1 hypothetical protein LSAT_V11C800451020 [Lactuca sativa]
MRFLFNTLESLRPLTESKAWDYCVVWMFDDDPSGFIKWIGCCCSGSSHGVCKNVKEETDELELNTPYLCKDTYVKHSVRTKACEKLAVIPSSLPLYPGIHGEVAMSKQPFLLSNDSLGTQLIVPVEGGLIELFRSKHVPNDQRTIETLISRLGVIVEHEFHENDMKSRVNSYHFHQIVPKLELLFPVQQPVMSSGNGKAKHKIGKEQYHSKNLVTERNRRKRIKDGLYTLRALVPRISKMDKASIVGDAIDYIKELEKNVKELQEELKELEEQECKVNDGEMEVCKPKRAYESSTQMYSKAKTRVSNVNDSKNEVEVEVEVHQIGAHDFLLKIICNKKPDGFLKIMETIDSLGLEVIDINVTTCNGRVLNVLNLEAKGKEVVAKSLKDSLLTSWSALKLE